ncbi:M3 family metallopeptidase [Corynebacterium sp. 320]|uniref:M3 family metallopeptidase n=1 Tax=Corynebacterium TaxID=1716 RepID=UPI00125CB05F|nr:MULTISPECIES: M3 family metallopeptidase [Corynebacterium]KAB1502407.1 M3 family metallopeptidase [Corynebacterium sp. 320]KAB1551371.1 M3 family metallopeptidase [Corynebacterium sp. 321]KAB1551800.1 M3 family metallopeptidase [Corynebacterium sp. 319]KAB3526014.1 M3 family metallopeptidase [Corynebacterium sp. 250]KAB3538795.1 M3 family metallopeptidase [Corynebacterium sp. 366]
MDILDYFATPSELDYELPDFAVIETLVEQDAIVPALRTALDDHAAEIAAIVDNPDTPTWENTFEALEASGQMLGRVLAIVYNYSGTMATDTVVALEEEVSPLVAEHYSQLYLHEELWTRIQAIPQQPDGSEEAALQKHWTRRFIRGGAELDAQQRRELQDIDSRLATLNTRFGNQLQQATRQAAVLLTDDAHTAGLSESEKASLHHLAIEEGAIAEGEAGWLIRLGLPSVQPILERLDNPEARELVHQASLNRAAGTTDSIVLEIVRLRARRARLLGYDHHAAFVVEEETAGEVDAVRTLLDQVTPAAVANAHSEYKHVQDLAAVSGEEGTIRAADWPYWSGKLRAEQLDVDEEEVKKYFPLERVLVDGAFFAAERLYNISVVPRPDLKGYHEDVQVWEIIDNAVAGAKGQEHAGIGLLLTDMYARSTKRGGAWMSSFVDQSNLIGQAPVVVNVLNIDKPSDGQPALLTMDEVATVFHEFGHALHGLLSDVRYPSLSGTSVPRDFVEFPSQINENWALEPEVLANYARHVETGEPLPSEWVATVRAQSQWAQGFATTEYLAACWLDLAWHSLSVEEADAITDVETFEAEALEAAGVAMDGLVASRYRSQYFNHIFSGGYSADYWSYLWAEVLDADGFQAFVDTGAARGDNPLSTGDIDADDVAFAGERFRRMILSRGATIDFNDAFWMFRGQQKSVEPLLQRRGLSGVV